MARVRSVVRATSDSVMDGRSAEKARRTDRPRSRDWTNSLRGSTGGVAAVGVSVPVLLLERLLLVLGRRS